MQSSDGDEAVRTLWEQIKAAAGKETLDTLGALVTLHEFVLEYESAMLNAWAALDGSNGAERFLRSRDELVRVLQRAGAPRSGSVFDRTALCRTLEKANDFTWCSLRLRLNALLGALETAIASAWGWRSEAPQRSRAAIATTTRPLVRLATSLRGTQYQVLRSSGRAVITGHSLQDVRWLTELSILPTRLDGAELSVRAYSYSAAQARSGDDDQPVRVGVWPVSRTLAMTGEYVGSTPLPGGGETAAGETAVGVYRIRSPWQAKNPVREMQSAATVLDACEANQVDILLIPELTTGAAFIEAIQGLLRERHRGRCAAKRPRGGFPWLVVCGSYHYGENDSFRNRCVVLTGEGSPARIAASEGQRSDVGGEDWQVDKRHQFKLRREGVPAASQAEFGLDRYTVSLEPLQVGERVLVVDTSIGRIWVTICLDFLKTAARTALPRYGGLADWILVPAATRSTKEFACRAEELTNVTGTASVMANACWLLERFGSGEKARVGLAYCPRAARESAVKRESAVTWTWASDAAIEVRGPAVPEPTKSCRCSERKDAARESDGPPAQGPCAMDCTRCLWIAEIRLPR